jgi:hypothetical protein
MSQTKHERNKALVLEAFDTLFNKRNYAAAERFWSPRYIQHSAHIVPGRDVVRVDGPDLAQRVAAEMGNAPIGLAPLVAPGTISTLVAATYNFDQVGEAITKATQGGKVLLTPKT